MRALEFAAVISSDNNDPGEWRDWSDPGKTEGRIARFKKPLPVRDPHPSDEVAKAPPLRAVAESLSYYSKDSRQARGRAKAKQATEEAVNDPLSFLIVKSMLLTGFDAPVEGVMYLDRPIREAELLQAIARVNGTGHGKTAGIIVDYYGVAQHLKQALAEYSADDIEGALQSLQDEIPTLRDRHGRVMEIFRSHNVDPIEDIEGAVELLADERLRADFSVKVKQFLEMLDLVLPRPEGLPFVRDAAKLGEVYTRARNRFREGLPTLGKDVGRKVSMAVRK